MTWLSRSILTRRLTFGLCISSVLILSFAGVGTTAIQQVAAQTDPLAGTYTVTGTYTNGAAYSGSLTIEPGTSDQTRIPTYTLHWTFPDEEMTGFAILHDGILSAAFGPESCEVIVYKFNADGTLIGIFANITDHSFGTETATPQTAGFPQNFVGTYTVEGVGTEGAYKTTISIEGSGLAYTITWNDETNAHSAALFEGNGLSAAVGYDEDVCGIISYTIQDNRILTGIFASDGLEGLGSELAIRADIPATAPATVPATAPVAVATAESTAIATP